MRQVSELAAPDARIGAETVSSRKTLHHVVALRELTVGAPFRRQVAPGAALCGARGDFPAPEAALFPPEVTCPNCSVEARYLGLVIDIPDN
jgi:hypothetical protein